VTNKERHSIQVIGDPTVDWLLAQATGLPATTLQFQYQWQAGSTIGVYAQPGGAALLTALLAAVCSPEEPSGTSLSGVALPDELLRKPQNPSVARTFNVWAPFPKRLGSNELVWRLRDFLGQQPAEEDSADPKPADPSSDVPTCLVIDDANLGFRRHPERWPAFLPDRAVRPEHVILKMSNPLASGPLWELLAERHGPALTAYFSLADFRKEDARIGQALSWEQISGDVVQSVREHKALAGVARVIVSLGASGAVVVEHDGTSTLVFDPSHQEGDWERERPGITPGLGTCVIASLAAQSARNPQAPDWLSGVTAGLCAARALHERGFVLDDSAADGGLTFPTDEVAAVLLGSSDDGPFQVAEVAGQERWTILSHAFGDGYRPAAERIVLEGTTKACRGVPVEQIGSWASVDRTEIESMRSVRNIIREYVSRGSQKRPLSIAVFGPPGAGKSFAIKQMAREWTLDGSKMTVLEYNLSQIRGTDELAVAFQRLRDWAVEGGLPLVFWDEFDTPLGGNELGWLPHFLAPMQDGGFLDGGLFRPIGPAIFVFAGGTHAAMSSFKARAAERAEVKATDFLSRLRGFVDILGPNPSGDADKAFVLRRAFLLRALLEQRALQLFADGHANIDPGVLRAFLDIASYVHGARSMEAIIEMSALSGKLRYERSALPAEHQLDLHVDAAEFLALVKQEPPP